MEKLTGKDMALGIQHLFAMFGATILVPLLTGLNPATALVTAGIGTLIFHLCTSFKVPVFQGSSFAYLTAISAVVASQGIQYAQGGIIFAGVIYLIIAGIAFLAGADRIKRIFPSVVTGPVIIVIGLSLVSTAVGDATNTTVTGSAGASLLVAIFTLAVVIICTIFAKGFFKLVPILIGLAAGYLLCVILSFAGVFTMDYSAIATAHWINIPHYTKDFFTLPKFNLTAILAIAPIAIVTCMEHLGDITTNGAVVGKDFFKDPGLHRTLLGDGLGTIVAGFLGGPASTTYSENTGVLATTKNYNPRLLRIAAVFAIILGIFGKFGAILQTIPTPVRGGVEFMLFGMISAVGIRTLAEANLDFTHSRNLIIVALILSIGTGFSVTGGLEIAVGAMDISISGLFLAVVIGVILNLILPDKLEEESEANAEGNK